MKRKKYRMTETQRSGIVISVTQVTQVIVKIKDLISNKA